ncbi:MAG: putative cytokinetic ring protein SteA, partial [Actinomycetes bacterium]
MRLATLRRSRHEPPLPGVHGAVRVDAQVRDLVRRARPGDVAVIDHLDLDAASARLLVAAGVAAVVNAAPSISGRYPNLGPQVLVEAGVPLLDGVGPEIMRLLGDGDRVRVDTDTVYRGDRVIARGELLVPAAVYLAMERARTGLRIQLEAFAGNTAEHLRQERDLLLDGAGIPEITTDMAGRPVVVVCVGPGWRDDLSRLRPWIRDTSPVLVGVDEGADALLSAGLLPDLVVGNPDLVSELALTGGAEVVVRGDRDGRTTGLHRAEQHGARTAVFPVTGTSEDAALLLAHAHDAALIVGVGSHHALAEFVDRGRADMAGTFLTRLKVGARLVDAAAVAAVYRRPAPAWP